MEISEREYYELKERVSTLQSTVDSLQKPKKITGLWRLLSEKAISGVSNLDNGKPIFSYVSRQNSEVWDRALLPLAKMIHRPCATFHKSLRCTFRGHQYPYIESHRSNERLPNIIDLTNEQIEISLQMLNEIIPIYNRYYKLTHQKVLYDPTGKGDYEPIGIMDDGTLREDNDQPGKEGMYE